MLIRKAVGAIVFQGEQVLIVHKTTINTKKGQQSIKGEWDFIKGGVEAEDRNLHHAILRELEEETGSSDFRIVKVLKEKICINFPVAVREQIGYHSQETTMFIVEFLGDVYSLRPNDSEISQVRFIDLDKVTDILSHQDTVDYFLRNVKDMYLNK